MMDFGRLEVSGELLFLCAEKLMSNMELYCFVFYMGEVSLPFAAVK